jgi:hypothetical protein
MAIVARNGRPLHTFQHVAIGNREDTIATMPPDELLRLWSRESLTSEMAIGHLIQNLVHQQAALAAVQSTLSGLRKDVERAAAQAPVPTESAVKRRPTKKS